MADCSYSRCIQQRRNIKRELQRWTKNMVYIVGLERIAEDLMGKRKWKLYQDSMQQRNYLQPLNNNVKKQQNEEEDEETKQRQQEQPNRINSSPSPATTETGGADDAPAPPPPAENGDANHRHDEDDVVEDEYKVKDWSPTSKCMFCVDGKLDEHNNHGALSPRPSDSESSDAASDAETAPTLTPTAASTLLSNHHRRASSGGAGMTALETQIMAMAASAALSGGAPGAGAAGQLPAAYYGQLGPTWLLSMSRNLQQAAAVAAAAGGCDDKPVGGEQPLDLSSKAGSGDSTPTDTPRHQPNAASMRVSTVDNKHLFNSDFRAKPRMSAVGGRRTYTEEELQAALRDIQSGKLGTRRAAVIYGIPRSTLRNKLTDEEEATDMDDKELSGAEEEKEVEKALEGPLLSYDDLLSSDPLKALLTKQLGAGGGGGGGGSDDEQNTAAAAAFAPHIQALLLSRIIGSKMMDASAGAGGGSDALPEVMKRLFAQDYFNDQLKMQLAAQAQAHAHAQSNGDLEKIARERPSPSNSVIHRAGGKRERDRDHDSDSETEDSGSNVILKIPSFRPTTAGSKNGGSGNGGGGDYSTGSMASPSVTSDSTSPPIALPMPARGLYQKDVKDLIAKSISQKFQQSPEPPQGSAKQQSLRNPMLDFDLSMNRGRFTPPLGGGISVIKSAQEPRVPYQGAHHPHHQQHGHPHGHGQSAQKSQNSNASGPGSGGGKGTRPKRGKYRNYDRDSLVEAVRAVQRGEMSVHRAGSYYGVPHSTLEYKVKERHLMRPRKRDPKPNPVDEKIASLKQNDLRNAAAAAAANEKMKAAAAAGIKPGPGGGKFAPASPNGIKLPMYDPALAPLGYNAHPFPFWPHTAYSHLPIDYGRPPAAAAAAAAAFPATNHEQLYASQMIQKLHEESRSFINPPGPGTPGSAANMSKSTRQIAESLLDPTESNGLLDGIIRSSLESGVPGDDKREGSNVKPQNMSNKTLLDQLCRNSRLAPLSKFANDHDGRNKENGDGDPMSPEPEDGDSMDIKPDITTIELSNDSNDSKTNNNCAADENGRHSPPSTLSSAAIPRPGMIYLKQELTKPENLKPEMLVRYRDVLTDTTPPQRNGVDDASASEPETHD